MMATLRRALGARSTSPLLPPTSPDRRNYQPVSAGIDGDGGGEHDNEYLVGREESQEVFGEGEKDCKVTWAFWVLGAGVLLSWNGEICPIRPEIRSPC